MRKYLLLAVVLIVAFSGPTFAAIVYTGSQPVTITVGESETIHIAGSMGLWDDFDVGLESVDLMDPAGMTVMGTRLTIMGAMGMGSMGMVVGSMGLVSNLGIGTLIGPDSSWDSANLLTEGYDGSVILGEFGAEGGYIGLAMPGSTYYGWLHMESQTEIGIALGSHTVTFDGWAYDDVAGNPIGAGVIPAPGALLLGGIGVGLVTWLRRRKVV